MKVRNRCSRLALTIAVLSALASPVGFAQDAPPSQDQDAPPPAPAKPEDKPKTEDAATLDQITVTGSRIPRASVEGPAPVTVINGGDIDKKGFRNVYDVLSTVTQNTGIVQGADAGSTFTPAANFINLRGLGPNHTLVLVNGHRVADYPVAYNGSINAVDLANIPSVMIERIEILSGSASAVYGSDAIAGVVNIILKKQHEGVDVSIRGGSTSQGGGDNQRFQIVGGGKWGDVSGIFGAELSNRDPLWYGDRRLTDSYSQYAQPTDVVPPLFAIRDPVSGDYYDLPGRGCDAVSGLMHGSVTTISNPNYNGSYCSSDHYYSYRTIQTKNKSATGYGSLNWDINENTQAFFDLTAGFSDIVNNVRSTTWTAPGGAFWNDNTQRLETWTRTLTPEEMGGRNGNSNSYLQTETNITFGLRGAFGDSDWHYEAAVNRSDSLSKQGRVRFLNGIDNVFLGPQTGTHDYEGSDFPSYNADPSRILDPLTPDQFQALTDRDVARDKAWTEDVSFTVNGNLFDLPAGPVGFAGVAEAGRQGYRNSPDSRINNGYFYGISEAPVDEGTRNRYAIGGEVNVPIFSMLTATGAARYDKYTFGGREEAKSTWNAGLEFRPIESLLFRGTYATSFRAPDMNYLFANETVGYFPGLTDYYRCRQDDPNGNCNGSDYNGRVDFQQSGSLDLKPELGKSLSWGVVWSPNSTFDISADYYRIRISDEVTSLDPDQILEQEADCLLGMTRGGTPVDRNSTLCQTTIARVTRNPATAPVNPGHITNIVINPINAASETTSGIDLSGNVRWETDSFGKFQLHGAYTHVLSHTYQQFPGDPVFDYVNDISYQSDWRTKINASVSWSAGPWSANLDGTQYGRVPTNSGDTYFPNYRLFNGSVGYDINDRAHISAIINNINNSSPVDRSGYGWPNYDSGWYDAYGRQWWLQFDYHFGAGPRKG